MNYSLRVPFVVWGLLLTLLGTSTPLLAQQSILLPLPADPARARHTSPKSTAARPTNTTALALPFFEDFAGQPEGKPTIARWDTAGGVLVNERYARRPPSRGVATFDGLNSKGRSYGLSNSFGFTDTLTSQPIDLSAGRPGDRTYLSYFWQAGSIVGAPSPQIGSRLVYLQLQFLDNTGNWVDMWTKSSTGLRTPFRQRFIPVNDARFMHANFRFRFLSRGSQFGTRDTWNLDYLVLDRNRDTTNVSYADVVLSAPLSSLLKRYTAMPSWQYAAASNPALELNDSTFTTFNNLDTLVAQTPFSYRGVVRILPSGNDAQFLAGSTSYPAGTKQVYIGGSVRNTPLSIPPTPPTRVVHSINLSLLGQPSNPRTAPNDTVRRVTEFDNYYAYDDGTAEGTTVLRQGQNLATARAIRFGLNRPDQVRTIRYYYAGVTAAAGVTIPPTVTLTFTVWNIGSDNRPNQVLATKSVTLPSSVTAGGFRDVSFDQPVGVSGNFFIGYTQPATALFIQFGADLNSRLVAATFYDRETTVWEPFITPDLVPMIRPVMTGVATPTHHATAAAAGLSVFPNPSQGLVQIAGRYARAAVLDALGRTAWLQPAAEAGQSQLNLRTLPAGVYLLRLTLPDGTVSTQRLVLQP